MCVAKPVQTILLTCAPIPYFINKNNNATLIIVVL